MHFEIRPEHKEVEPVFKSVSFLDLVLIGVNTAPQGQDYYPWSFNFLKHPVSHENNKCYLLTVESVTHRVTPDDVIVLRCWPQSVNHETEYDWKFHEVLPIPDFLKKYAVMGEPD